MIEDVFGGALRVIGRFVAYVVMDFVVEILVKAPGYFIVKSFAKKAPDPDGAAVFIAGILFWLALGFGVYGLYSVLSPLT